MPVYNAFLFAVVYRIKISILVSKKLKTSEK